MSRIASSTRASTVFSLNIKNSRWKIGTSNSSLLQKFAQAAPLVFPVRGAAIIDRDPLESLHIDEEIEAVMAIARQDDFDVVRIDALVVRPLQKAFDALEDAMLQCLALVLRKSCASSAGRCRARTPRRSARVRAASRSTAADASSRDSERSAAHRRLVLAAKDTASSGGQGARSALPG